jgi:hypothetical protein
VRAPEPLAGTRVVAAANILDALSPSPVGGTRLRFAADELFVIGDDAPVPESGIVVEERGYVGWWLTPDELAEVLRHVEWPIPATRPALAQGLVAGVPAKIWLTDDRALLLCAAAYAHELIGRLR